MTGEPWRLARPRVVHPHSPGHTKLRGKLCNRTEASLMRRAISYKCGMLVAPKHPLGTPCSMSGAKASVCARELPKLWHKQSRGPCLFTRASMHKSKVRHFAGATGEPCIGKKSRKHRPNNVVGSVTAFKGDLDVVVCVLRLWLCGQPHTSHAASCALTAWLYPIPEFLKRWPPA